MLRRTLADKISAENQSQDRVEKHKRRAILIASTGGHLSQLDLLANTVFSIAEDSLWITFKHPQSESLLKGRNVRYVPYIAPRDFRAVLSAVPLITSEIRGGDYEVAYSTGAAIAAAGLPAARALGIEANYIESISRFDGPSRTGKLMGYLPGIRTYTQHSHWSTKKWRYEFSVLDSYQSVSVPRNQGNELKRIFVTLGTIRPYRFDSLVDAILQLVKGANFELVWQLGETYRHDLPGKVHETISMSEFDRYVLTSDICITHAGAGSALRILDLGKCPVMVPRRRSRNEHVDDHQSQIAGELSRRGLARAVEVDELDLDVLKEASVHRIKPVR